MQYTTLLLAALSATSALPGARKGHQHHRRHAKADANAEAVAEANNDYSNVNWAQALAGIDWATVKYTTTAAAAPVVAGTTTVAVVGAATAAPPSTTTSTSIPVVAGNVVQKAQSFVTGVVNAVTSSTTTSAAAPAKTTTSSSVSSGEYAVTVINNCAYTIWQAGWQTNTAGALISSAVKGNEMAAGSSITLAIPKAAMGVQIWPRTGCTGSGSSFHCQVGDCQGFQCSSIIWQDGPIMAEFGSGLNTDQYNTGITAYDISAIPGNNCGAKIVPSKSSCETKYCPVSGCSTVQAWLAASDMELGSPADTTCSNDTNFTVTFCPA
ncbi:protein of unknown function [Taphrina deformans PYCC 5710]|uniref:Uncharacterized protein n=1 Tax=Taphrina deformans (strain PYCC 5710 / ATCC 11124 / CBS 356.35 / IMI 108563 / JCM 9778 / NBRC 8474) TaxID=1097556 RepID=R4XK37_TAPDE|nr:protein of unknown function [Taphrina deformans PYCC 5710]|eukprot:CCG83678.1 protein of unknown function [Taphrina deformans PYCC 5710]